MKKILMIVLVLFFCILCTTNAMANVSFVRTVTEFGKEFCWFCPIFGSLFDAMNKIATQITTNLSEIFLAIMGTALLFSIGFKTAKMLTSLQAVDLMQYLTDLFRHLGRAIIASALLWTSLSVFTYIVSPFLTMSLTLSTSILNEGGFMAQMIDASQGGSIKEINVCNEEDTDALPLMLSEEKKLQSGKAPQEAFAPSVKAALMCMMKTISASLIGGMAIGATFYEFGWWDLTFIFPNILAVATGALIVIGHLLIFIAVPFKYIDSMVRLAFVCALMPLWVVLWVFEATRGYTKKAWDMFLSTCAIFLCMSVVLILVIHLINAALPAEVAKTVVEYMMAGQILKALAAIDMDGKNFLVTLIMCFTGYKMLGTATTLASSFIGSIPNLGVGDQMAKTSVSIAQTAKTAGVAAGMAGGRLAKSGLNKLGDAMGKPGLGDKVATSAKRVAGHTAAALATGGTSLFISGGMAVHDALKNRSKGPAPARPTFGKGGSTMGIQAHDMELNEKATAEANKANPRPDEDIKVFKDDAGNTVTQTRDKNTGKLKNEKFEDAKGRQLVKTYDQDGNLKAEQTRYSERATQETKNEDKEKGNHQIWTKTYDTKTEGDKKVQTVKTFGEDKKLQEMAVTETTMRGNTEVKTVTTSGADTKVKEKAVTETTRDKDGNTVFEKHTVTDKDEKVTLSEQTKYADNKKAYTERVEQVDDGQGGKKEKRTYTNYSHEGNTEYREHRDGETGKKHTETIVRDERGREKEIVVREGDKAQSVSGKGQVIRETVKEYYADSPDRLKKETTQDNSKGTKEEISYERNSRQLKKIKHPDGRVETIELQNEIEIRKS